jgi:hypothetical protein
MDEVSRVLADVGRGDREAAGRLLPLVYDELRKLAAQKLTREQSGLTLQATALVHEAYLRLLGGGVPGFDGHGHLFASVAESGANPRVQSVAQEPVEAVRRTTPGRSVSTHAPARGATDEVLRWLVVYGLFQPSLPQGERPIRARQP